jgi:hypothetical protein
MWRSTTVVGLVVVSAVGALTACSGGRSSVPSTVATSPSGASAPVAKVTTSTDGRTSLSGAQIDVLRSRPVKLPTVAGGAPCPVTTDVTTPSTDLGPMLGLGQARPVGLLPPAQLEIAPPENYGSHVWGGNKVLWALSTEADGPALIRGGQLDGDGEVRFDKGDVPSLEKVLDPSGKAPLVGGWYDFPGATRVRGPGCYGYQIDSDAGTTVVVFEAV